MTLAMSSIDLAGAPARAGRRAHLAPRRAQVLVLLAFAAAALAGFMVTDAATAARAAAHAGEGLTRLLRAMAMIKAAMALGVMGAVVWRLGAPATTPWLAGYGLAAAVMAAGPGLIWDMANLGLGALLLHAGLLASAVMLWRDPVVGRRLSALIAARGRARPGLSEV